jgi:chromosome partitioning protein
MVSPKGGVGKTTAAAILGATLAERGETVVMVDADPNQPLKHWASRQIALPANLTVYEDVTESSMLDEVERGQAAARWVIIDVEGSKNLAVSYAVASSDLVIIPTQRSQLDVKQAGNAVVFIEHQSRAQRRDIPCRLLLTRGNAAVASKLARDTVAALRSAEKLKLFEVELFERTAFQALFAYGGGLRSLPSTIAGRDKAIENADAFVDAVIAEVRAIFQKAA